MDEVMQHALVRMPEPLREAAKPASETFLTEERLRDLLPGALTDFFAQAVLARLPQAPANDGLLRAPLGVMTTCQGLMRGP
jgi:hypothetical protein